MLIRYKIKVIKTKNSKRYPIPDDVIFIEDGDTISGYGYNLHTVGKYFDLWFTSDKAEDPDNFVTLGRVLDIEALDKKKVLFKTKLGTYVVEQV